MEENRRHTLLVIKQTSLTVKRNAQKNLEILKIDFYVFQATELSVQ